MNTRNASKIRILLVDDHVLMRLGITSAVQQEPDMEVVADVEDGTDALPAYRTHQPDVVIMDLRMSQKNGLEAVAEIRAEFPQARILILSNYGSGEEISLGLKAGASGFVLKDMGLETLLSAIRAVHNGERYIPDEVARRVTGRMLSNLSQREMDVLKLIGQGKSNKEIAAVLNLVEGTVKLHVTNILAKLGVADRTQAVVNALKRGLLEIE